MVVVLCFLQSVHFTGVKIYFCTSKMFSTATHPKQKIVFLVFFCLMQKDIFASNKKTLKTQFSKGSIFFQNFVKQNIRENFLFTYKYIIIVQKKPSLNVNSYFNS